MPKDKEDAALRQMSFAELRAASDKEIEQRIDDYIRQFEAAAKEWVRENLNEKEGAP